MLGGDHHPGRERHRQVSTSSIFPLRCCVVGKVKAAAIVDNGQSFDVYRWDKPKLKFEYSVRNHFYII